MKIIFYFLILALNFQGNLFVYSEPTKILTPLDYLINNFQNKLKDALTELLNKNTTFTDCHNLIKSSYIDIKDYIPKLIRNSFTFKN